MNVAERSLSVSKHRMEALADGVFAIVMTLLVLELKIPELSRHSSSQEVWLAIRSNGTVFLSFVITFILSGAFWNFHQVLLRQLKLLDGRMVALNIAFLMFVSLLPFSTGLLGRTLNNPFAQAWYFGNQVALGFLLSLQLYWAVHKRNLENPGSYEVRELGWRIRALPAGAAVAMLVAFWNATASFYSMILVVLLFRLINRIMRRRAAAKSSAA